MNSFKTLNLPDCALCSSPFSVDGYTQFRNIKLPLLLHCGHAACESCLNNEFKNKKEVSCNVCNAISTVSDNFSLNDLSQEFPISHYMAGMWYLKIISNNSELDSSIKFSKPKNSKRRANKSFMCNECSESQADCHCKQCDVPYCCPCFKLVHSYAKAFRCHTKVTLLESYLTLDTEGTMTCLTHTKYKLEYYCTLCHIPVCSHCMVESHNGHTVYKIEELDLDYQEEFLQSFAKLSNILSIMKTSKKNAEKILRKDKGVSLVKKTEDEIMKYFSLLHGKLSLAENQILKNLSKADTKTSLEEIIRNLSDYIEDVQALLASTRTFLKDGTNVGATCLAVVENLKARQKLPCYLIESGEWNEPRFLVNKVSFENTLKQHFSLETTDSIRYQLVTEQNLPSGYEIPPIQEIKKEDVINILNSGFFSSESSSVCDSERPSSPSSSPASEKSFTSQTRDQTSQALQYPDDLPVGCSLTVRISHLISPSHFYVQKTHAKNKLIELQASLRHLSVHWNKPPSHPEKGKVYFALYETDSKWYRARIVKVIDPHTYEVFYVDYGNSEIINRSKLRSIPKKSLNMPFMAYRCQLSNCVPRYGEDWDPKAISLMTEIIDNDSVTITVVAKTSVTYVIELYKATENCFINLRESLTFHELASMTKMFNQTIDISVRKNISISPQVKYSEGDIIEVHVSHVDSPYNFYVQALTFSRKLVQLSDDLQRAYGIRNSNKNTIYDPKKGMPIAACYSKDSKWYRGTILECLEGKQVRVFFIDFGDEESVSCENVKLLLQKFCNLPPQAIKCGLSDVAPLGETECWTKEVCSQFKPLIFDKKLKLIVDKVESNTLNVLLYEVTKNLDICINAIIVKDGLAVSTGSNSILAEFPKITFESPKPQDKDYGLVVEKRNVEKKIMNGSFPEHFVKLPGGGLRTKVVVKKITNPGDFYVMPSCFEDNISLLKYQIQEFYENKTKIEKEWVIDDRCVVYCDKAWHRAIVLDIQQDGLIKINLVDEGIEKIVDNSHIDVMDSSFATIPDGAIKCHLAGLEPAQKSWALLSISVFEEFVNNRNDSLYINQLGNIKDNSLPVELFSRATLEAGPTEPIQDDWKSFNHYLRFIGLAKGDGLIQWDSDGKVLSITQNSDEGTSVLENLINDALILNEINITNNECSTKDETHCSNEDLESIVETGSWLPPLPLTSFQFVAAPTYVDENCTVYLHDFHKSEHVLRDISTALSTKYGDSLPHPHDQNIQPGEICIAQYHLDNNWYRAILLEKLEETKEYKIQFVDYGNVEICKLAELRRVPVAQHIPIQCYKCIFHKLTPIDPSGKWKERHIELVQYTIVDKHCQVQLVEIPGSDLYGIERLLLPDGQNYISEMIKENYALLKNEVKPRIGYSPVVDDIYKEIGLKSDSSSSLDDLSSMSEIAKTIDTEDLRIPESIINLETKNIKGKPSLLHWSIIMGSLSLKEMPSLVYKHFEIPPVVKSMIVEVSAFLSPLQLILHIEDVEEDPMVLQILEDFKELSNELQIEGPKQPKLSAPYKYKACCSMFSLDRLWYRGFILEEMPEDQLLLQYVDYGNVEIVSKSSVHELKVEWANIEVQGVLCSLYDVALFRDCNLAVVMEELQKSFEHGVVKAEIMERNPDLQVKLYKDEDLAYQNLIDSKLFYLINSCGR